MNAERRAPGFPVGPIPATRLFLRALLLAGAFSSIFSGQLVAGERLELEVHEVAGIRRHEPVSTLLTLPGAVPRETPFRLLRNGSTEIAQFRPAGDSKETAQWWLDFSTKLAPFESQN